MVIRGSTQSLKNAFLLIQSLPWRRRNWPSPVSATYLPLGTYVGERAGAIPASRTREPLQHLTHAGQVKEKASLRFDRPGYVHHRKSRGGVKFCSYAHGTFLYRSELRSATYMLTAVRKWYVQKPGTK